MHPIRIALLGAVCVACSGGAARAQNVSQPGGASDGWAVTVYPVLAWVPVDIGIDVDVPGGSGQIFDSRFDGAFLGGVSASNLVWRIEGYFVWASFGGDRPERPSLAVDM